MGTMVMLMDVFHQATDSDKPHQHGTIGRGRISYCFSGGGHDKTRMPSHLMRGGQRDATPLFLGMGMGLFS